MDANDFMTRGRVSNQSNTSAPAPEPAKKHRGPRGMLKVVMVGMIISVAILVAAVIAFVVFGGNKSEDELIKTSQYQAVFLNDQSGQVYFGKLSVVNSKFYKITDIFYVRVNQVQPDSGSEESNKASLVKLGSELHGPEDEMFVPRDKVLFWENLKNDGKVAKAIVEFKTKGSTDSADVTEK